MRSLLLVLTALALLTAACDGPRSAPPAAVAPPVAATTTAATAPTATAPTATAPTAGPAMQEAIERGEVANFRVDGDTVYVNNTLCAVSHGPLKADKLDAFTSTVAYTGSDPRFVGKKLVFNQCCGMCARKFAGMWQKDPEQILRFHGLLDGAQAVN